MDPSSNRDDNKASKATKKQRLAPRSDAAENSPGATSAAPQKPKNKKNGGGSGSAGVFKLPPQLVALVQGEEQGLMDEGFLLQQLSSLQPYDDEGDEDGATEMLDENGSISSSKKKKGVVAPTAQRKHASSSSSSSVTQIVAASQNRFTKELSSYTRAVCMRLGYG